MTFGSLEWLCELALDRNRQPASSGLGDKNVEVRGFATDTSCELLFKSQGAAKIRPQCLTKCTSLFLLGNLQCL